MNKAYVIDSFAWIEYAMGSRLGEFVQELLTVPGIAAYTPAIVVAELAFKFNNERLGKWDLLFKFLRARTQIIPLDAKIAEQAGVQKVQLRQTVKGVGLADAIIYQTALNLKALLVSGDPHFETVSGVIYLRDPTRVEQELTRLRQAE